MLLNNCQKLATGDGKATFVKSIYCPFVGVEFFRKDEIFQVMWFLVSIQGEL